MGTGLFGAGQGDPQAADARLKRQWIVLSWMAIFLGALFILRLAGPAIQWVFNVLAPFLIGLVLAYVFNPIVIYFQQRLNLKRGAGLAVVAAILVLIVLGTLTLLVIAILQLGGVLQSLSEIIPKKLQAWQDALSPEDLDRAQTLIRDFLQNSAAALQSIASNLLPRIGQGAGAMAQGIMAGVGALFSFFSLMMFVSLITIYYLLDFDKIPVVARSLIPPERRDRVFSILGKVDTAVGGYLRGQLLDCLIVGVLVAVFMLLVGPRKYALLIGALAGAVNFIPYLGPIAGGAPAVLWALFNFAGVDLAVRLALIIGSFSIVQAIDGFVLQPKVIGGAAQLHPLAVLLALLIGAQFGIGGMVVAIPSACVARVLIKELWWNRVEERERMLARKKKE